MSEPTRLRTQAEAEALAHARILHPKHGSKAVQDDPVERYGDVLVYQCSCGYSVPVQLGAAPVQDVCCTPEEIVRTAGNVLDWTFQSVIDLAKRTTDLPTARKLYEIADVLQQTLERTR